MERLDELRQMFAKQGAATDADMDEYIKRGGTYDTVGGEKSKAWYNERKKLLDTPAAQPASDSQDVSNIKFPSPVMPVSGNSGYTINDEKDAAQARKNIRKLYANDNTGYKNAIKEAGVDAEQDPNAKYKMKSIQQAYYDGEIDKNTRDYLLADTIGKFARNMGKDVGNIAAAYSGGTVNNEREGSLWDARNEAMASTGVNAEQNKVTGSTNEQQYRSGEAQIKSQDLSNRIKELQKTPAENFSKEAKALYAKANDPNLPAEERQQYKMQARLLDLVAAASTQEIGAEEYMATLATNPEVQKLLGEILKGVGKGAGFASELAETTIGILGAATDTFKGTDKVINESKVLTPEEKKEYNTTKDKKVKQELEDKAKGTYGGMYPMT